MAARTTKPGAKRRAFHVQPSLWQAGTRRAWRLVVWMPAWTLPRGHDHHATVVHRRAACLLAAFARRAGTVRCLSTATQPAHGYCRVQKEAAPDLGGADQAPPDDLAERHSSPVARLGAQVHGSLLPRMGLFVRYSARGTCAERNGFLSSATATGGGRTPEPLRPARTAASGSAAPRMAQEDGGRRPCFP